MTVCRRRYRSNRHLRGRKRSCCCLIELILSRERVRLERAEHTGTRADDDGDSAPGAAKRRSSLEESRFAPPKRSPWISPHEFSRQTPHGNQEKNTLIFHVADLSLFQPKPGAAEKPGKRWEFRLRSLLYSVNLPEIRDGQRNLRKPTLAKRWKSGKDTDRTKEPEHDPFVDRSSGDWKDRRLVAGKVW